MADSQEVQTEESNTFTRVVNVNRSRRQWLALEATRRVQYVDHPVVDAMPKGEGDTVEVVFFKPDLSNHNDRILTDDELEQEFELRGLKPADPISVAAVNEADRDFADEKPHGTHWKDADGNWYYTTFYRLRNERKLGVGRHNHGWDDRWWFAGIRK